MKYPTSLFAGPPADHTCPRCGQRIRKLNPHRMDRAKWKLLCHFERLRRNGIKWVKVQRDGNLIKDGERFATIQCDDVHALRLTWFALAERLERRSGLYRITRSGRAFLAGLVAVPTRIWYKDGHVVRVSQTTVKVHDIKGVYLNKDYWDHYGAEQEPAG